MNSLSIRNSPALPSPPTLGESLEMAGTSKRSNAEHSIGQMTNRRKRPAYWPHCANCKCSSPQRTQDKDSASGVCPVQGRIDSDSRDVNSNHSKRPQPEQSFPDKYRRGNAKLRRMKDLGGDSLELEEMASSTAGEGVRRGSLEPQPQVNPPTDECLDFLERCRLLRMENIQLEQKCSRLTEIVTEQRDIVSGLQRRVGRVVTELPRYCRWEAISKVLADIVSYALLGCGQECHLYPSDDDLIRNILGEFNISMDMHCEVKTFLSEWGQAGKKNLRALVGENVRDRRGWIIRTLRAEFYAQLGLPRPKNTEPEEVIFKWKEDLKALKQGNAWRESRVPMDPWGTDAVHHSLARVMYGAGYDRNTVVTLNLKQAGFFFHNLELAMDGLVMGSGHIHYHQSKMTDMENRVKSEFHRNMKRIEIKF